MLLATRFIGSTEFAWLGCGSKFAIVLSSKTPVPGTTTLEPNMWLIVCVAATILPSRSAVVTCDVLSDSASMGVGKSRHNGVGQNLAHQLACMKIGQQAIKGDLGKLWISQIPISICEYKLHRLSHQVNRPRCAQIPSQRCRATASRLGTR